MKKIIVILTLIIILGAGFWTVKNSLLTTDTSKTPKPALGVSKSLDSLKKIKLEDREYSVSIIKVDNPDRMELIANFSEKLTASGAFEKYSCKELVNGGFYLGDSSPTGLFIAGGKTIKGWIPNRILNGVLSINEFGTPRITFEPPKDRLVIGLQTGPVFRENAKNIKLNLSDDKPSRRIAAAITGDNIIYFIVVFNANQTFDGPYLADMPEILLEIEKESGIIFADAINLDGGSASTFYSAEIRLSEISPVGSFFCTK